MNETQETEQEHDLNNFDLIAHFYDELVAWAPYDLWVSDLLVQLRGHGLPEAARILDAACGTGLSTIPLTQHGYEVTGIDRSGRMLDLARQKAAFAGPTVRFLNADLLTMDVNSRFHAVICLHSGLDYILELDRLREAFSNVRRCLLPGGLFAFDKCLDEPDFYMEPQRDHRDLSGGQAVFDYRWDRKKQIFEQDCRIRFNDADGRPRRVRMIQRMLAVAPDKLVSMVEEAGFETLKVPRQFTVQDPGMGIFRAT